MKVNINVVDKTQKGYYQKALERFYKDFPFGQLHTIAYSEKSVMCQGRIKGENKNVEVIYTEQELFN